MTRWSLFLQTLSLLHHFLGLYFVTHFPTVQREVYRGGVETGDYVNEHTGLVGYTSLPMVLDLIARA